MYKQIIAEIDSRHDFYTRMCLRVPYYPFACPSVRRVVFPPLCHSPVRRLRARPPFFPNEAEELFKAAQENAQWRYKSYLRMLGTAW